MSDAVLLGQVMHRRGRPPAHDFRYAMSMIRIDLDRANETLGRNRGWSVDRRNVGSLQAKDYLEGAFDTTKELASAIRERVKSETGMAVHGRVELTTQPRCWGISFNPINLYRCHHQHGELNAVVVEVNNTPWGENIAYVLPVGKQDETALDLRFAKQMHVSPFQPMALQYRLRWFRRDGNDHISLDCLDSSADQDQRVFAARMNLHAQALAPKALNRLLLRNALMPARVATGIYWQAFRLWLKRATYFPHPGTAPGITDHTRTESSS